MTKVKLHPMIRSLSGKSGDVVFKRTKSGKTIMTKVPDMSKVKHTRKQKRNENRFGNISQRASRAIHDPASLPILEELAKQENKRRKRKNKEDGGITLYNMAVRYLSQGGDLPTS